VFSASVPYAIFAFVTLKTSILLRLSFPGSRYHVVFSLPLQPVFPASWYFCTAGRPYFGGGQLLARSTIFLGPNFSEDVSLAPCHSCAADHLLVGDGPSPPGFATCLDPSL
jgi:hypothetical protein